MSLALTKKKEEKSVIIPRPKLQPLMSCLYILQNTKLSKMVKNGFSTHKQRITGSNSKTRTPGREVMTLYFIELYMKHQFGKHVSTSAEGFFSP